MKEDKKKVFIKNFGCQMNVRDSEVICGLLAKEGYKIVDAPENADIVLLNTCSVRQHAEDKVWSEVGRIVKRWTSSEGRGTTDEGRKNEKFKPIIGIVGCMAQNYKDEVFKRAPAVDFVVGPSDIHKIPGIIAKVTRYKAQEHKNTRAQEGKRGQSPKGGDSPLFEAKIWETDGEIRPDEVYHTGFYEDKEHAFVVISEGCSNYCAYCVVPYVRGQLHHRGYKAVLNEVEEAIDGGITKITLLGQNVNAYKGQGIRYKAQVNFIELLKLVNNLKGLKEFSFITSHPKDTSVELFKTMAELDKLKKYLHLPVQAGSDRILKLMNRNYTRKFYLDLADNYRKIVKAGVLTTDIIVGFPTETEADFKDTYNLVKDIGFDAAFIFKYSVRPHTKAANMADDLPKEEKERRHRLILELQKGISRKKNAHTTEK